MALDACYHIFLSNVTLRGSETAANKLPFTVGEGASMILADTLSIFSLPMTPTCILASMLLRKILRVISIFPRGAFIAPSVGVPVDQLWH